VTIEKHGRPVAVVMSVEEYERLKALKTPISKPVSNLKEES
jgi:PHD/YefM family antitoxin component YafN of YafNO toxin-antitoxin module